VIMLANVSSIVSCVGLGWVGLGQSADGLGWIGSHKMDPWTTVIELQQICMWGALASGTLLGRLVSRGTGSMAGLGTHERVRTRVK